VRSNCITGELEAAMTEEVELKRERLESTVDMQMGWVWELL
jgi:hypothetical protein